MQLQSDHWEPMAPDDDAVRILVCSRGECARSDVTSCLSGNQVDELSRGLKKMDTPSSAEKRERGRQQQQEGLQVLPRNAQWQPMPFPAVPYSTGVCGGMCRWMIRGMGWVGGSWATTWMSTCTSTAQPTWPAQGTEGR